MPWGGWRKKDIEPPGESSLRTTSSEATACTSADPARSFGAPLHCDAGSTAIFKSGAQTESDRTAESVMAVKQANRHRIRPTADQ